MGERIQPGGRVDRETYEQFKQFVENQHGTVRGNLGRELEKAMSDRMSAAKGADTLTRIENDVATIKAVVADAESDGGEGPPTPDSSESARARSDNDTDKPAANQPRGEKIDWLVDRAINKAELTPDSGTVNRNHCRVVVKNAYNFTDERKQEYTDEVLDRILSEFDAKTHPEKGDLFMWGADLEAAKEQTRKDIDEKMDTIA